MVDDGDIVASESIVVGEKRAARVSYMVMRERRPLHHAVIAFLGLGLRSAMKISLLVHLILEA